MTTHYMQFTGSVSVDHLLVWCSALTEVRQPILDCILRRAEDLLQIPIETDVLVKLLLDCTGVIADVRDT